MFYNKHRVERPIKKPIEGKEKTKNKEAKRFTFDDILQKGAGLKKFQ